VTARGAQGRARWPHLERADLEHDGRLLQLARRLVRDGFLPRAEASVYAVYAAAEHALARGTTAGALFAYTLRHPELVTEAEAARGEARARAARAHGRPSLPLGPRPPEAKDSSREALLERAAALGQQLLEAGPRATRADLELLQVAISQAQRAAPFKGPAAARRDRSVALLGQLVERIAPRAAALSPG